MKRFRKLIDKVNKKKSEKKCYFCATDDYAVLDCHRIIPGEKGGDYTDFNTIVVCSNCHRKIHSEQIKIDRKYLSTSGRWILHYWIDNVEKWE
jgi:hypothetical protein